MQNCQRRWRGNVNKSLTTIDALELLAQHDGRGVDLPRSELTQCVYQAHGLHWKYDGTIRTF